MRYATYAISSTTLALLLKTVSRKKYRLRLTMTCSHIHSQRIPIKNIKHCSIKFLHAEVKETLNRWFS